VNHNQTGRAARLLPEQARLLAGGRVAGGGLRGGGAQRGGLPLGAAAHALAVGGQAAGLRAQRAQLRQRVRVEVSAHAAHSARTIRWPLDFQ